VPHLALSIDLDGLDADAVEAAFMAAGALSVTYTDRRDDPILEPAPGEFRLWPASRLQGLFATDDTDLTPAPDAGTSLAAELCVTLGVAPGRITAELIADRPWEREWLKDFHAQRYGARLWICPTHEQVDADDAIVVRLDPGLAFGTGTHATTRLCLEWLEAAPVAGMDLIDYGCGSGILGIAALKLGARRVAAFDIDPQALVAARDNSGSNGIAAALLVCESATQLPTGADALLANILSGPLCELAPRFAQLVRPGGHLVMAGLLVEQMEEVRRAAAPWFELAEWRRLDGWSCLAGRRKAAH
jgi:ribosomal protein L11 methyltransferase